MVIEIYSLDRGLIHKMRRMFDDIKQDYDLCCLEIIDDIHKTMSHIDLLIIDLDLGEKSKNIANYYKDYEHVKKIFVSGHKEDVYTIFKYHPSSFLVKNDDRNIKEELMRCIEEVKRQEGLLLCKQNGRDMALLTKNILSISQKDHFAEITMCDGTVHLIHMSLHTLNDQLGHHFFLINRSDIINLNYMRNTDGKALDMIDGSCFRISRRKQKAFLALLHENDDRLLE